MHAFSLFIASDKCHPTFVKPLHIGRIHLVTVTMALPYNTSPTVELTYARPLGIFLEHCWAQPEAHSSTHVSTRDLRHEYDDWVRWV